MSSERFQKENKESSYSMPPFVIIFAIIFVVAIPSAAIGTVVLYDDVTQASSDNLKEAAEFGIREYNTVQGENTEYIQVKIEVLSLDRSSITAVYWTQQSDVKEIGQVSEGDVFTVQVERGKGTVNVGIRDDNGNRASILTFEAV